MIVYRRITIGRPYGSQDHIAHLAHRTYSRAVKGPSKNKHYISLDLLPPFCVAYRSHMLDMLTLRALKDRQNLCAICNVYFFPHPKRTIDCAVMARAAQSSEVGRRSLLQEEASLPAGPLPVQAIGPDFLSQGHRGTEKKAVFWALSPCSPRLCERHHEAMAGLGRSSYVRYDFPVWSFLNSPYRYF